MANWLDAIKDALNDALEILPLSLQWLAAGLVLFIIVLLIYGIVKLFSILF